MNIIRERTVKLTFMMGKTMVDIIPTTKTHKKEKVPPSLLLASLWEPSVQLHLHGLHLRGFHGDPSATRAALLVTLEEEVPRGLGVKVVLEKGRKNVKNWMIQSFNF